MRLIARLNGHGVEELLRVDANVVAEAMLALDDREAFADLVKAFTPRGRGRPPTLEKHLRIMNTIEAYIGVGMSRDAAIERAADKWALGFRYVEDIYKANKLPRQKSRYVRHFFAEDGDRVADVDEAIRQFRQAERLSRE